MDRLQKYIASMGYCSRRKAEELINRGHVKVNGLVVKEHGKKVSGNEEILIFDKPLVNKNTQKVYYALNKPRAVICTVRDPKQRKTVLDFFPRTQERLYPVGRLDYDTSGLVFITNDGDFANIITHPSYIIDKKYHAQVRGNFTKHDLQTITKGVVIDNNGLDFKTSRCQGRIVKNLFDENKTIVELIIHEGKNHQVKKMFDALGFDVLRLKRLSIGHFEMPQDLRVGQYMALKPKDVKKFFGDYQQNINDNSF
ncbi:rRNA pseudouridine synthase [Spiroplasma endosymbiont of Anurida maritima]|uniref:pseudouridine synthase n=1 Tax=Spiroplasma endosymbiont of Anurida maritima TaxID=2967972 RepID=UPI0036D27424